MRRTIALLGLIFLAGCQTAPPSPKAPAPSSNAETPAQRDARMKWWREARFGMFVHWGLYSGMAGTWEGKPVGKTGGMEWIQQRVKADTDTYAAAALPKFKPTPGFAREWAKLAKEAGCRYIVFTTKHHEGFGLYDSKAGDYNAGSKLHRDLVKEIVEACHAEGLKVGFYHSVIDWHHDQYCYEKSKQLPHPLKGKPYPNGERDHSKYVDYLHKQVGELVSNYGNVDVLWWDYSSQDFQGDEAWRAFDLMKEVRAKQPAIIMNNRLFRSQEAGWSGMGVEGYIPQLDPKYGDFITPEQHIPATGMPGVDWETCMTLNTTWGYSEHDQAWKSDETLIRNLVDIASKGGNYLLNIGPKGDGSLTPETLKSFQAVGAWMKKNGEAIYATQASPFESLAWGRCTQKRLDGGNTRLYLHIFDWPKDGKLVLNTLANKPLKACLLDGGKQLDATAGENCVTIALPAEAPDKIATVVALDIAGAPKIVKPDPYADETPAQRDARMKWWREARFGMFIHWGVYAVPAGTYKGKQIKGIGEWIMHNGKIPVAEYREFARQFNPVKYNADEWVKLAKEAGMKYIVITSKHHDGFALFDSKASDWNIVKATPYGKDLLKPLAEACCKHGLKLGFYYSQAQDWTNPGGAAARGHWDPAQDGDMTEYIRKVAAPQVREILTRYGEFPAVLWWDTPKDMTPERAEMLIPLLKLKPGIIHNNRLGGGYKGDTETPEQHIPATGYPGRDWETCMTMNDTWGFKSYDDNWKPVETLIRNLVDIASKGGNYLLNVGPTAEGCIPGPSIERLKEVGKWMKVNSAAIYATSASPFKRLAWGRCTKKLSADGATLHLHVFNWPADGKLLVPGLKNAVESASLLATGAKLAAVSGSEGVTITVPAAAPDPICSVVVLKVKGALDIEQPLPAQAADGTITLTTDDVILHGKKIKVEHIHRKGALKAAEGNIGFWLDPAEWIEWQFKVTQPGKFEVSAEIAATGSGKFTVNAGSSKLEAAAPKTGDFKKYKTVKLGTLEISAAGKTSLAVKPVKAGWQAINLSALVLKPVK
jgi:alpha-L-fucosidase